MIKKTSRNPYSKYLILIFLLSQIFASWHFNSHKFFDSNNSKIFNIHADFQLNSLNQNHNNSKDTNNECELCNLSNFSRDYLFLNFFTFAIISIFIYKFYLQKKLLVFSKYRTQKLPRSPPYID
jgi:hypothetical protein